MPSPKIYVGEVEHTHNLHPLLVLLCAISAKIWYVVCGKNHTTSWDHVDYVYVDVDVVVVAISLAARKAIVVACMSIFHSSSCFLPLATTARSTSSSSSSSNQIIHTLTSSSTIATTSSSRQQHATASTAGVIVIVIVVVLVLLGTSNDQ